MIGKAGAIPEGRVAKAEICGAEEACVVCQREFLWGVDKPRHANEMRRGFLCSFPSSFKKMAAELVEKHSKGWRKDRKAQPQLQ